MKKILWFTILAISLAFTNQVLAASPIQLSLTPDIAIHSRRTNIEGLTLSIWGENPQSAFALGLVNGSTGSSAGFSLGILNYADSYKGLQWACVNYTKASHLGWQLSFINYTEGSMKGLQTGWVNYAGHLTGVQFGFVNYAAKATTGVQIGILNLLPQNGWFKNFPDEVAPGMVLVNWRF